MLSIWAQIGHKTTVWQQQHQRRHQVQEDNKDTNNIDGGDNDNVDNNDNGIEDNNNNDNNDEDANLHLYRVDPAVLQSVAGGGWDGGQVHHRLLLVHHLLTPVVRLQHGPAAPHRAREVSLAIRIHLKM